MTLLWYVVSELKKSIDGLKFNIGWIGHHSHDITEILLKVVLNIINVNLINPDFRFNGMVKYY